MHANGILHLGPERKLVTAPEVVTSANWVPKGRQRNQIGQQLGRAGQLTQAACNL